MSDENLRKYRSMGSLLPPNYMSDEGRFDLNLPRIRPAWLMNESIKSLNSKFPMIPAPTGSIVFYTTPLGEKLRQHPKNREFDLTDPLRPSLSYNYLHDEHLQVYFKSNDIKKRLLDEGFITDDGYVKCSLKEFNEYREWIRKLKLDELHRERRQDEKQIADAKKERLERIALERDPELLEIMKRRREKRREEAKIHQKRIKKEQDRLRKLGEIDRQRREKYVEKRRKTRDRIQIKRDLERERLRKKKCEDERQEHKIRLRIVRKIDKENDERLKHLEERKREEKEIKIKKLEEKWLRRGSWTAEYHENQKQIRERQAQEFNQHVEERNIMVAKQRRRSQVSYNEVAEANRRAFERQLEKAEVFLAKLNDKKAEELRKWRQKFDAMQKSSCSTLGSPNNSCIIKKLKQRTRRQSAWDLESCLLKDLGIAEHDIKENSYSKLGVISRTNEFGFTRDALGSLMEEKDDERHSKDHQFPIPTIVESLASIRDPSSDESDSDSEYSFHIPSVFRMDSFDDLQPASESSEVKPNDNIPEHDLRRLVGNYVRGILRQSADVLGVDIKFQERTPREQIPRISDIARIPKLKTKEVEAGTTNMRVKVKEYLSGILDKVENRMQVTIKRPEEYEKIKQDKQATAKSPVETSVKDIIDSKLHYHSKRNVVRLYLCKILEDAAEQSQTKVQFPPEYQSYVKRLHRPKRKVHSEKKSSSDRSDQRADEHAVVLRAIAGGTVILESAEKPKTTHINSESIVNEIERTACAIEDMTNKYDRVRAERLFHENLVMMATRTVVQALNEAVLLLRAQRRNSDFFMSDMPNMYLKEVSKSSGKEQTVLLKKQRSRHRRESLKTAETEHIPREIDFLRKVSAGKGTGSKYKKGGKEVSYQSSSQPSKESKKKIAKYEKLYKTDNSRKKTENKAAKRTGIGAKKIEEKKKTVGTEASRAAGKGTGDKSRDVEVEIKSNAKTVGSSVNVSVKVSASTREAAVIDVAVVDVTMETLEGEPRIKEIETGTENGVDSEVTETDKENVMQGEELHAEKTKCSETKVGDKLGDDGVDAPVSTLSMKSPSLPHVTPEPSGFGLSLERTRSGAVPANTGTASDLDRNTAGSPSSAIFRMINMRETRESCDLSPESSYVVLPTLTSSEGALINSQLHNSDDWNSKSLESSSPSFPALTPTPSQDTHVVTSLAADHINEPVKLPSVTSVESCPSRSTTPVRSPSRSSQVALPQIGGSNTSLVGNDSTQPSQPQSSDTPQNTGTKTPPAIATPTKTTPPTKTPTKPTSPPKNAQGQLQTGRTPVRTKSEISRKPISTPTLTPRKGGQVRSTTVITAPKTPSSVKKSVEESATPGEIKKPANHRKSLDIAAPHDRLAKSKSTGEAIIKTRQNSLAGSQSKKRPSEATIRTADAIGTKRKPSTTEKTSQKSETNSKKVKEKTDDLEKSEVKTSTEPLPRKLSLDVKTKATQNNQVISVHDKSKPTKTNNEVKSSHDAHEKSTDQNKSTQNAVVKSVVSGTLKSTQSKMEQDILNTETKYKPHEKATLENQQNSEPSNLTGLTLKEPKAKSKSGKKRKKIPRTQIDATEPKTTSESLPNHEDESVSLPESPTTLSPKFTPESSPTPKEASLMSEEEIDGKPQAMIGALVTSPDIAELAKVESPIENVEQHTILKNTESETEFYMRKFNVRKVEDGDEELPEENEENHSGNKRKIIPVNKPKVPKAKKKITRNKHKNDEDGGVSMTSDSKAKIANSKAKITDSKAKISDSKAKISDGKAKIADSKTKISDSKAKISSSKVKVSVDITENKVDKTRKSNLKSYENIKNANKSRSDSKSISVQAISEADEKGSEISKSRRSSRSVSFSSRIHHSPDTQGHKKESVDRLTKRRSSQKVAKKASSKELKKRRPSLSSELTKGKTKSSTEGLAKVESNRKVSDVTLSKSQSKTTKKSSKHVVVNKSKSQDKAKVEHAHETRTDDTQNARPLNDLVERTQEVRVEETQETLVENAQDTRVENTQEEHAESGQNASMEKTQEAPVDSTCLDDTQGRDVDGQHEKSSADDSQDTHADELPDCGEGTTQESVEDSPESRMNEMQKSHEGSDENLQKSESDEEVVVQVYVPDEGQTDAPEQTTAQVSQESGDKSKHEDSKPRSGKNDVMTEGTQNVTKIDLTPFPENEPAVEMKKVSSRRAFGDNVVEKKLVNIVPRNSMDIIKGTKLTPNIPEVRPNRSFHSRSNLPRAPTGPKPNSRGGRRNPPESRAIKVSNFELPNAGKEGTSLKPIPHGKPQLSVHRLASKMSTNLEKVDEGSALETEQPNSPEDSQKLITALNISKAGVKTKTETSVSETEENILVSSQEGVEDVEKKNEKVDEVAEKKVNQKTEPVLSNKSLQLLMKASSVCINSASFTGVVQGTQFFNKESATASDEETGIRSSASLRSNSSQPLVPSPPISSKPDMVSPRISRMISRNISNGSGKSRGSHGSTNEMSPTASMEIVKLASNSSHGWVSSPTSSVKFLPPIDARASKASNRSDDSNTKRRPRTAESAVSRSGSLGSGSNAGSETKAAVVELRRSGSGDLRIDGSSTGVVAMKSSSSTTSPKQAVVGF